MNNSAQSKIIEESLELNQEESELSHSGLVAAQTKTGCKVNNEAEKKVIDQVGHLTRILHDSLRELGYDKRLEEISSEVPKAQDRLSYVALKTEQAAERVLNAAEIAMPIQEKLAVDAVSLSECWKQALEVQQSIPADTEKFKDLLIQTLTYLHEIPKQTGATNAQLIEIMMAQDFQDLTGQVIKKITIMVQELENELLRLLVENIPPIRREKTDNSLMNGPVVNPEKQVEAVVVNQDQVDDLLASLGF